MGTTDTIFALSSGRLPSGVAIVRMSGPRVRFAIETMFGRLPPARIAAYGPIGTAGVELDRGICLYFPGTGTVTGEDCGEFHLHGGVAVVKAVFGQLAELEGLRPAEAGEFTLRGFLNGKLDLTSAEALSDLIAAETEEQRRLAAANSGGRQRELYLSWRSRVLSLRARVEADLDFSDQEDVPVADSAGINLEIQRLAGEISGHMALYRQSEIVRSGYAVVIVGAPNSGKSSLLNVLAMRDAALVSDEAGTTRDAITVSVDVGGYKVNLTDTAGIREDVGRLEAMGIERARRLASEADLLLVLSDLSNAVEIDTPRHVPRIEVGTKVDLVGEASQNDVDISTATGVGIDRLLDLIGTRLSELMTRGTEDVMPTRERHVGHLFRSAQHLCASSESNVLLELRAEELRLAAVELGRIVGMTDTEELLGEIFSRFCVGK